jgi:phosphomannomutase
VGDGLDPATVAEFAAAYASECEPGAIIVGHDGRMSAAMFEAAVVAGVTATGHDVLIAGPTATPTIGWLVRERAAVGAIEISASHNPPEYNGLKFFQPEGMVQSATQGRSLLQRYQRREFAWASWQSLGRARPLDDPDSGHRARVVELVDSAAIRRAGFRVVLDACHGAGGRMGSSLIEALGAGVLVLGGNPDGRYDHRPEPTEGNLLEFCAIVRSVGAAVGFAQDPDADRVAIVDEAGRYIGEELTLALAVKHRLEQAKGPVVINLSTSRVSEDLGRQLGFPVFRAPVGEINVVERMISENAVLGGEGNGGVIDPRVGYVRDSFVAMAMVLDLMAKSGVPLSQLVAGLPKYTMVKAQFPVASTGSESQHQSGATGAGALFERIASAYPAARADRRDGLRLDWDDRWVHVRASNTEPIVRVIAEAVQPDDARELADRIGRWVSSAPEKEP